ncbi:restriction endonuclease subunit S [Bacillus velezensis]|uniref:restriction endonuclease subunit S n=1 Tax=Bacillus TaxID=1386 RepID=UPI00059CA15E|nr:MULTISPECIES: restriction endonuclease subunit S [Bacillus]MBD0399273.1 restriction endonuclease subunit S [Bacillus sp. 2211]NRS36053.1 restriction endonuclease subunit S [Bacillus velezensis]NRS45630.1 restriction endonuclease subunit S [Bacillus velezensis]PKF84898.1 restriction endonuclease subunit S [Bacillus velezensis]WPB67248.1 restriction endonuclease subunit S [Bacillus velezensis]
MENKRVPEVRFEGFSGKWEKHKLSDIKDVRDGTHDSPKYYNKGFPLVTSKNLKENGLDMTDVSLISEEDFQAINKRSKVDIGDVIFGMIGTIGNPVIVDRTGFAIKNVALIKHGGEIRNEYLIQLLRSPIFKKYIRNENAGNTQKFLGLSKIRDYQFLSPSYQEQTQIGTFFKQLDDTITLHRQELSTLKQAKQGFLQKMFPKEGESMPEVRFSGFTGDWEQRKLREMLAEPVTDGPHETPKLEESGIPFISVDAIVDNQIDFDRKRGYISEEIDELYSKKYRPQYHDVFLVKSGSTVGKTAIVETKERFNIWSPLAAMRVGEVSDPYFLYFLLQTRKMQNQVKDKASSGTQPNLGMRELEKFHTQITPNLEEQKKIGAFFQQLDNLITLHQRELEALKKTKKAFLQKMFV